MFYKNPLVSIFVYFVGPYGSLICKNTGWSRVTVYWLRHEHLWGLVQRHFISEGLQGNLHKHSNVYGLLGPLLSIYVLLDESETCRDIKNISNICCVTVLL